MVAGALAAQALNTLGITVTAYTSQVADIKVEEPYNKLDLSRVDNNMVRCPDAAKAVAMIDAIAQARKQGDTLGGIVTCVARGVPPGLGEPVFGRLNAQLAAAMMSINAAKGVEIGLGFDFVTRRGSQVLDHFTRLENKIHTTTNYSGGIQGGISNGEDIYLDVAFKPVATLMQDVDTVDLQGKPMVLHGKGRHDPCVVPRAVPIVESMTALVLLDNYLLNKTIHL